MKGKIYGLLLLCFSILWVVTTRFVNSIEKLISTLGLCDLIFGFFMAWFPLISLFLALHYAHLKSTQRIEFPLFFWAVIIVCCLPFILLAAYWVLIFAHGGE